VEKENGRRSKRREFTCEELFKGLRKGGGNLECRKRNGTRQDKTEEGIAKRGVYKLGTICRLTVDSRYFLILYFSILLHCIVQ
jgi:hypothetical protein